MRILEPLKAFLAIAALLLVLTVTAQAQGPGGGPGGGGGAGNGGSGSRGPGGNGAGGRSEGDPGGSPPNSGATSRIDRGSNYPSSANGMPPTGTTGSPPAALDGYVRGPDGALDAVEANQALPLDQIVAATRHLTDGEIIDAQLNAVNGALQYEVKVLETTGAVRRFLFDARTAQLAEVR